MIQINESDWRFVMKRQKKQYRPIAGQRWYEKLLDWVTSENFFRLLSRYPLFIVVYLFVWVLLAYILFDSSETALLLFIPLFLYYLFLFQRESFILSAVFGEIGLNEKRQRLSLSTSKHERSVHLMNWSTNLCR